MIVPYFVFCFVVAVSWTEVFGQNANTTAPTSSGPGMLVWTELNVRTKRARINSLPANPEDYISSASIATTGFYESTPAHWIAITNDYDEGLVFWTDAARKRIMKGGLGDGAKASAVFTGTSQTVDGIAVDWLANNIYWADGAYDWIILANYNLSYYKVLVDTEMDKPRGIALFPQRGYLFWTDWGDGQKVERSNLAGENRTLIADTGLYYPNGLAVDYTTDKLYWVDADPSGSRIEVCDLDGNGRRTVFTVSQGQGHLFDLAIFGDFIFISDWHEQMRCIRKTQEEQYFALNVGARPFGVTVFGPGILPGTQSPCDSSPCEHLCVSDGDDDYKCVCSDNFELLDDGHTCETAVNGLTMPQILLASKNSLCSFPGNFPDMIIPPDQTVNCFLTNRSFAVALEVDIPSRLLFYSDFEKKTIERVRLLQGESVDTIRGGIGSVEGLAVDWLSQNIYWTDALYHHIAVSRYDGQYYKAVVKRNIIKPRSIVIHAGLRLMFWTEFGPPGHIEKAGLDGKNREIIVSGLTAPNGLAIDFHTSRLYFSDRESGSLEHVDFDGGSKRSVYTRVGAQYFDMDIFKDYIIWTEWNNYNGIHAMNRENGRVTQSLRISTATYGVKAYAPERQPNGTSVCGDDNGGCDHLCLPRARGGFKCDCGTGYTLAYDGRSCVTNIVTDDFMLATDSYLHGIVQIFIDDSRMAYTALDLGPMTNPIGVDYDPVEERIYWSDVKEQKINRAFLNGTGREVIAGPKDGVRISDDIAIDSAARLIYWTDAEANITSVARLDGSRRKTLISNSLDQPRAIALDIENGYMYFSDWGDNPRIERAFMDGTNRQTIISTDLGWPNGIALDLSEDLIYWCDAYTNKIERSSLTGENRTVLVDLGEVGADTHAFGIAVHGPYIFWTDWKKRSLMKADKVDGSNNGTVGRDDFIRLNGIKIYSAAEDTGINDCAYDNGGCSGLCLHTPNGTVCACQDGDSLSPDGRTCWEDMSCPGVIPNGNVSRLCSPDGTCPIICDEGYTLGATDVRVSCLASGEWDIDTSMLCQVVECNPLSLPLFATALPCPSPYMYGATCSHRCDTGWERQEGDEQRRCQADGKWSGTDLVCDVVTCDPLVPPEFGSYSNKNCSTVGGHYNDLCIAQCQEGFQLLGVTERACLATGEWTDADANSTCIDVTIPIFSSTCVDITVTAPRGQLQANVSYSRPNATDNSGKPVNIWSRRDEYLDPPILMDEGDYIMTFYAQDWVHNTAGCTFVITVNVIRCPLLASPLNGFLDNCQNHYGASCAVTCNEGFRRQGDEVRTCEIDANGNPYWKGQRPSCQQIECSEAEAGQNTMKSGCSLPYVYGTECIYLCLPGYVRVSGSNRRQCQADSTWDGRPLQCEIQQCGFIPAFDDGIISPASCMSDGGNYDDVCSVSCEAGFRLVGAAEHRCLQTGKWSNNAEDGHFCIDIRAPHFNNTCPQDFTVFAQKGEQDAEATWSFDVTDNNDDGIFNVSSSKQSGSRFSEGNHTVLVRAWDMAGNMGTCEFIITVKVVRCPDLPVLPFSANGSLCDGTHYGAQCSFACIEGYMLVGNSSITCEWDHNGVSVGHWSGNQPQCQVAMCPKFQPPDNMVAFCRQTAALIPYGTRCLVTCAPGYQGSITNWKCQSNGEWGQQGSNDLYCDLRPCESIQVDSTVTLTPSRCLEDGRYGDSCTFSCPEGYEMKGSAVHNCTSRGKWSNFYSPTTCSDVTAPIFDGPCPRVTALTVEPCKNSSSVIMTKPTATDNSGSVTVLGPESAVREIAVGEHVISYIAFDDAGNRAYCNLTIVVRMVQCPAPVPQQDRLESLSCFYHYGTVATYRCPPGQRPSSSSQPMMCSIDGQWTGTIPECEEINCDPLQAPSNAVMIPTKCSLSQMPLSSSCFVSCFAGYAYRGLGNKAVCQEGGTWSIDVANIICHDIRPPDFQTCPNGIDIALQPGQNQTTFNWEIPTATDNSGDIPVVKNAERIEPPLTMGPGYRIIQYVATDSTGNSDYCIFTVTVRDAEPPTVKMCPSSTVRLVDSLPVVLTWTEPVFTDNIAVAKVTSNEKPGFRAYSWGRHTVTYTARDAAGNEAQCVVFIDVVDSTSCLPLTPPVNGALACESNQCTVHCNSGYVFTDKNKPQAAYACMANGFWSYGDSMERSPNLPACSKVSSNNPVDWQRRDKVKFELHHLDGNCEDVQQQIQSKFQQLLQSSAFMDYCRRDPLNNCKVDNVEVQCGDSDDLKRRRRQVDEQQPDDILSLIYNLFGQRSSSEEIDALLTAMNMSVSDVFGGDNITLTVDGQRVALSTQEEEAGQIEANCFANQTLADDGISCVYCPVGTKLNQISGDCIRCPRGTYQDAPAQTSCQNCDQYKSTASEGATSQTLCIDTCKPGEYSPSGLIPCQKCPRGSYQQNRGQKGCTPCPEGMTTRKTGATISYQCASQDQVGPLISTALPAQASPQSTRTQTTSTGKIDISSTSSSVVITMVSNQDKGSTTLKSQPTPEVQPNTLEKGPLSFTVIIASAVGALVFILVFVACIICIVVSKTRRKVPRGARPLSWAGSETGIMSEEDDDDGGHHGTGYQQLEEHPDYKEMQVTDDKRYYPANAIANPAYEPTFATFKDDRKRSSIDPDDSFGDSFHIFAPSDGPLDSVELD